MRGRLIFPMLVQISQLDTVATDADPDGAGPLTSGYDRFFRTPLRLVDGTQTGSDARIYSATPLILSAQIETKDDKHEEQEVVSTGDSTTRFIRLVFHFKELESKSLIDPDGKPTIRVGDRLDAILDPKTGLQVEAFPDPPGMFVTKVPPQSYGLSSQARNLLLVTVEERMQGKAA